MSEKFKNSTEILFLALVICFITWIVYTVVDINNPKYGITNFETNKMSIVKFNKNTIFIDNIAYTINMKELGCNIENSKSLEHNNSIVSSLIIRNGVYCKYDIIYNDDIPYIIFYKFADEDDTRFPNPMFRVDEFEKILENRKEP